MLAKRMERESRTGSGRCARGDPGDRFYVSLRGCSRSPGAPWDGEMCCVPAITSARCARDDVPRTATVTAITPAVRRELRPRDFDEFLRPLFADD